MTILRLRDMADERLTAYTQLTNHQLRNALDPRLGITVVESEIAIRTALAQGAEPLSFLVDERKLEAMADVFAAMPADVAVFVLPPDEARKITGYRVTRGALSAMRRPPMPSVEELLARARNVVALEGITDTSNVGALFRNAAALGADAVLVAPTCADPLSRRAVRVSMGNVFCVPWARAASGWPHGTMRCLEEQGFLRLALALGEHAIDLRKAREECDRAGRGRALFFGSEGSGLSAEVLAACDKTVVIPMRRGVDSLNVAASSAVAMWELFS